MNIPSMSDWSVFCDSLDLDALVPEAYIDYRPVITDCAAFVLKNLSPLRTIAILAEQLSLPADSTLGERMVVIARHSPGLHKLGQLVSRDRRLPLEFRRSLQCLETMPTEIGIDEIRGQIEAEIGALDDLGIFLDGDPLAEASVAVVVPFLWRDGDEEKRGVFKVLKEGIEERLEEDLELLAKITARLDRRCEEFGIPPIDYEGTFAQVRELLSLEIRLDREQENLALAAPAFAGLTQVWVPALYPFCSPRVTAMERIDGCRVTDATRDERDGQPGLALLITEALLARPLWSSAEMALFHADPHAGNLILTPDNRLGILDWSLVGGLSKATRVCLTQIIVSALSLDAPRIIASLESLSERPVDPTALRSVVDDHLAEIRLGAWPGITWMQRVLESAQGHASARFGVEMVLFWKVLHVLRGVIGDVDEDARLDGVLARLFLSRLGLEWSGRLFMPPFSRASCTNLSNADIFHLLFSAPAVASRFWWRYYGNARFRDGDGLPAKA